MVGGLVSWRIEVIVRVVLARPSVLAAARAAATGGLCGLAARPRPRGRSRPGDRPLGANPARARFRARTAPGPAPPREAELPGRTHQAGSAGRALSRVAGLQQRARCHVV